MRRNIEEVGNGPVDKEEEDNEITYEEEEEEEEYTEEEFLKLNAELDALHSALDNLEQRNDSICDRLRKILAENQAIREDMEVVQEIGGDDQKQVGQ
ncbi:hypothetical protein Pcinc_017543 [Petrolisthes cinctipes]|uniref:Uncharacterized protein n=1 Tax=Petrolisthes cinctipes TaxID=88211 RepID=A0AAE1FTY9_PETCI|nr:hypothetical protein Pcinc_017543 [Petrolisthes cinctipes]